MASHNHSWLIHPVMRTALTSATRFISLRGIVLAAMVLLLFATSYGQARPSATPPPFPDPSPNGSSKGDSSAPDFGSPESEMRAKVALKAEKKEYDENVARAREVAEVATQLVEAYAKQKSLASSDAKKLERLEKLTKKIRNEAGGSETDPDVKDIPAAMEPAVKRMGELAEELRKLVESTPRHVISASVIDQANKLLGMIQHVRDGFSQ
jgi:flagellar biosynthesis GTPase FlhF